MDRVLTPKGQATRERLVAGAAEVVRDLGVGAATLDDIRARTGTSKSQLFHYFPDGKDALLLAVAQYEADRVLDDQQPYLGCLDSWDAWYQWRDAVVERYEAQGDFCPLGSLFQQIGRSRPGARAIVVELMRQWQESLAAGIRALQRGGPPPRCWPASRAVCRSCCPPASPLICAPRWTGGSRGCGRSARNRVSDPPPSAQVGPCWTSSPKSTASSTTMKKTVGTADRVLRGLLAAGAVTGAGVLGTRAADVESVASAAVEARKDAAMRV
jgi:AcrR family transcriptional regulator